MRQKNGEENILPVLFFAILGSFYGAVPRDRLKYGRSSFSRTYVGRLLAIPSPQSVSLQKMQVITSLSITTLFAFYFRAAKAHDNRAFRLD